MWNQRDLLWLSNSSLTLFSSDLVAVCVDWMSRLYYSHLYVIQSKAAVVKAWVSDSGNLTLYVPNQNLTIAATFTPVATSTQDIEPGYYASENID